LKHQRLDRNGDGAGGLQNFAEVDEVEVVEGDAVDGEDVVFEFKSFLRMLPMRPARSWSKTR